MKLRHLLAAFAFVPASMASSSDTTGDWGVDTATSAVHYVSIKKDHVAERHFIGDVSGSLSENGKIVVTLGMASVSSGVDVRDKRLREILFDVSDHPMATFTGEIDMSEFEDLTVGETIESYVEGEIELVGVETFLDFDVNVTRVAENKVIVTTLGPILLDAAELELDSGIEQLREIAKLPSISLAVPVFLTVSFTR